MRVVNKFKKKSGQAIVEFAMILPILVMIVFGLIDFSRLIYHNILITDASKEALRLVSIGSNITSVSNRIKDVVTPVTGQTTPTIVASSDKSGKPCTKITLNSPADAIIVTYITPFYDNTLKRGDNVKVEITYTYNFITPIKFIFNNGVYLQSSYYTLLEVPPK